MSKSRKIVLLPFGSPCLIRTNSFYACLILSSRRFEKLTVSCPINWQIVSISVVNIDFNFYRCFFVVCNCNVHFRSITWILVSFFSFYIHICYNIECCPCWNCDILIFWGVIDLIFTNKFKTVISCVTLKDTNHSFRKRNSQSNSFWVNKLNFI